MGTYYLSGCCCSSSSSSSSSGCGPVSNMCCPDNPWPCVLYATASASTCDLCPNGTVVTLTYNPSGLGVSYDGTALDLSFNFACETGGVPFFDGSGCGEGNGTVVSCDPLQVVFNLNTGDCTIIWTVTS